MNQLRPKSARPPKPKKSQFAVQLGSQIRKLRTERSYNQRDLAALANLPQPRLSSYESGTHEPPLRSLIRIARIFGLLVDSLLPETADLPPDPIDAQLLQEFRRVAALDPEEKKAAIGLLAIVFGIRRFRQSREEPKP